MNISKILVSASLLTLLVGASFAQKSMKAAETCPACHMALSAKKTKGTPVAVKTKSGKTLYCCAACKMKK